MLARSPFKTAEELGLSETFYDGLLMVLDKMKKGGLIWTDKNTPRQNGFNMAFGWYMGSAIDPMPECGTIGCIAGWAQHLNREKILADREYRMIPPMESSKNYNNLVCPPDFRKGLYTIEQAQIALESYLLTGEADWS